MPEPAVSPEEFDLLAAELALGVIEGEDRVRALRLQLADRNFRAAVLAWHERLAPMLDDLPSAVPGPNVWLRIAAMLEPRAPIGLVRRLRAWRVGAMAASAAAALLAVLLVTRPAPEPAPPTEAAVAQLLDQSGAALLVARYDQASGTLRVRAVRLPEGRRVPELWVIPAGGAPQSLGLISRIGVSNVDAEPALRALLRDGAVIAVTLEPADGVPHQAPSGAILGSAPLSTL
jgi:anti-sigma-K factor RskA